MSIPKTDSEWAALIATASQNLPPLDQILSRFPEPEPASIAGTIDHTLLALSATESQIDGLCDEAREYNFATVCVRANYVSRAVKNLQGSPVGVACVIGFHEGTYSTEDKVTETKNAIGDKATELDMVLNYPWLKAGRYQDVYEDILAVRNASNMVEGVGLKVILETAQLSREEIIAGCVISCLANADYVKTSTGFNGPGATVENVALMRAVADAVKGEVKVKASGGVRTVQDCVKMIRAGAARIGASAGVKIVQGALEGKTEATDGSKGDGY